MIKLTKDKEYNELVSKIGLTYQSSKSQIITSVNNQILLCYWEIGKYVVEFEQGGSIKAEYGKALLSNLSKDLSDKYGKGFSRSNLSYMRLLYNKYPICETLSRKLTWSHYFELLKIDDDIARQFYEKQAISEQWTIRELKRQKKSGLFHRLSIGKNKEEILNLAKQGQIVESEDDLLRSPYVFEFLNIPENKQHSESDLERAIIDNLQQFLLELGKGFAFIGRQQRITLNNKHYYVDFSLLSRKTKVLRTN